MRGDSKELSIVHLLVGFSVVCVWYIPIYTNAGLGYRMSLSHLMQQMKNKSQIMQIWSTFMNLIGECSSPLDLKPVNCCLHCQSALSRSELNIKTVPHPH